MNFPFKLVSIILLGFAVSCIAMEEGTGEQKQQPIKPIPSLRYKVAYAIAKGIVEKKRPLEDIEQLPEDLHYLATLLIDNNLDLNQAFHNALLDVDLSSSSDDIKNLIEAGANINAPMDSEGNTPLLYAIQINLTWLVELLLEYGADSNLSNIYEESPLMTTITYDSDFYIGKKLIENNADVNHVDIDGSNALFLAAYSNENMVKLLLDHGANANHANKEGTTVLMNAAHTGNENIVKLLLNNGADVNKIDNKGSSALSYAVNYGNENIVKLLIDHGANIDQTNNDGATALMYAVNYGYYDIIKLLLERGANINFQNNEGATALMFATVIGNLDVIKLLLEFKANAKIVNSSGNTALDLAQINNKQDIVKFLESIMV